MTTAPEIRPLSISEVDLLLEWARQEGWNPGLEDAAAFLKADPEGFLGCFTGNAMVAGTSAVRYGRSFGFIGLYICLPDYRGKGFGKIVWDAAMRHLEGRMIGLDGVPQQQPNYRRMGFEESYRTIRWSGKIAAHQPNATSVYPISARMLPDMFAYDRQLFPAERDSFLQLWLQQPREAMTIIREGAIAGYAVLRRCHEGYKIGPLFADGAREAEDLFFACVNQAGGDVLHLDVPETQEAFSRVLQDAGMAPGFETSRMYKNGSPTVGHHGVFAITTLELG
ncbi:MAG: GNAT family N-acetyltransferase [Pseudorhizobium sp.]